MFFAVKKLFQQVLGSVTRTAVPACFEVAATPVPSRASDCSLSSKDEIVRVLEGSRSSRPDQMWIDRSLEFIHTIWPAIELAAKQTGGAPGEAMYHRMKTLEGMEKFVARYSGTAEAAAISGYLSRLPGYVMSGSGRDATRENASRHQGYVHIQIDHLLARTKTAAA